MEKKHPLDLMIRGLKGQQLKNVEIGKHAFLLADNTLYVRKESLYRYYYLADRRVTGNNLYFKLNQEFEFKEKPLSVKALRNFDTNPAGDRWSLSATYDGKNIGSISGMRSYMGGGINGTWPVIKEKDSMLVFLMEDAITFNESSPHMEFFAIEYYEKILTTDWKIKREYYDYEGEPIDLAKNMFLSLDFPHDKQIDLEYPLPGHDGQDYMKLISYPNYQYYELEIRISPSTSHWGDPENFYAPKVGTNHLTQMEFFIDGTTYLTPPLFMAFYAIPESLNRELGLDEKG